MSLETGFALNVTLRAPRGRPVSCRRRGVRSEVELSEPAEAFGDEAMTTPEGSEGLQKELCVCVYEALQTISNPDRHEVQHV